MASEAASRIRSALFPQRVLGPVAVDEWREGERKAFPPLPVSGVAVSRTETTAGRIDVLSDAGGSKGTIIYFHGGGYVLGSSETRQTIGSLIARASGATVLLPNYRLAPEWPFPAAIDDALATYRELLDAGLDADSTILMGDSAGGGIAASLLLAIQASNLPIPAGAALLSPWLDLTLSGDSYQTRYDLDPLDRAPLLKTMAKMYAADSDPSDPLMSPLFGDLRSLPPLLIQVGDHEILLDDSTRFATRAQAFGVPVSLTVYPEMWHVWQLAAPDLPEACEAIEEIAAFVQARLNQRRLGC